MFLKWHARGKYNDSHNIYKGILEANRSLADTHWFLHKLLELFFQAHPDTSLVVIIMTHLFCVAYNYYWCVRSGQFDSNAQNNLAWRVVIIRLNTFFFTWNDYKSFLFLSLIEPYQSTLVLVFFSSNILIACPCFLTKKIRLKINLFSRNMIEFFFLENKFILCMFQIMRIENFE